MNPTPGRAPKREDINQRPTLPVAIATEPLPSSAVRLEDMIDRAKAGKPSTPTADELRSRLLDLYEQQKPAIMAFYQYSASAAALSEEYHAARFIERFPAAAREELTLACTLDSRETPASLDKKLAELAGVTVKKIVYDRARATYYLFV